MKIALIQKLIDRMKVDRKFEIAVYAVLVVMIVVLYALSSSSLKVVSGAGKKQESEPVSSTSSAYESERELENRLKAALENIRGAGKVDVMITYETGPEIVPALNVDSQSSASESSTGSTVSETQSQKPATINQGSENQPIVLTEIKPTIRGVIVIAEGASDIKVAVDLQRAVQTVLGIDIDDIEVFEMSVKEETLK